jgi:hypothetical protein
MDMTQVFAATIKDSNRRTPFGKISEDKVRGGGSH